MPEPPRDPSAGEEPGRFTTHGLPSPKRKVGRYEVIRQIGRGGMATVYLARQTQLERNVALKELSSFHASAPEFAERFLRESRLAGSLNHPNIVTVFEYFEEEGTPYIAMEYVAHGSLRPYVGRLQLPQFAGVMEGILAGLAHAETYGIVHRDLKPENIMVTGDGRVKITDFGIAKATQRAGTGAFLTATGTTVGTPTYMAPEQAMAQEIGMWTDLYSVGVMAYEHVVGRVPFYDTEAPMMILMRHVNEPIPPAVEVNPEIDEELSGWIDRLIVKDPRERTQTAVGAWDELEEIVLRLLGPRWRRQARLPEHITVLDTPRALTPAPFDSTRGPTTPPPGVQTPAPGTQTPATPMPMPTGGTAAPPATPTPTPTPASTPTPTPAPTPTPVPAATESEQAYMTYGAAGAGAAAADAAAPDAETVTPTEAEPAAPAEPEATGPTEPVAPAETPAGPEASVSVPAAETLAPQATPPTVEPAVPPTSEAAPPAEAPAPPTEESAPAAPAAETSAYMTFGRAPEAAPPEATPPEAAPPEAAPPEAPAAPESMATPAAPTEAPPPEAPEPEPEPDYLTYGHVPEPAPPPVEPAPEPVAPEPVAPEPVEQAIAPGPVAPPPVPPEPVAPEPPAPEPEPEPQPAMAAAAVGGEAALASSSQTRAGAAVPRERGQAPSPGVARRRIAVLAIVGVVIAAAIGFLIAPSSKKSTPSAASFVGSISSGPLQVSLPAGWSRGTVVGKNLGLSNEFAAEASAAGGAGTLVMGSATTSSPTLLPAKVLSSLGSVPTPQTVTLGKNQFLRYLNVTPKGGSAQTVYAIPTTAGTVVAFCQPQGASTAFASNCERVVGSLQLSSGSIRGLGPDSSYGSKLSAAIGKLNSQQASASSQLAKATKPGDQAKAAAALAAAYHQAATAVKHLQAGTATTTNAAIAASLGKTGDGYAALQQAAAHNDGKGYSSASHQISSSLSDLSSQMGQLAKLGYTAS